MALLKTGMFVGEFRHNLDEKGRLTIPSTWRPGISDSEGNHFLALPSPDGYITVYPPKKIAQLEASIAQISLGDREGQQAVEELMASAHSFSCDKQGRIILNQKLIDFSGIEKGAVLLGKLSTFSIYSETEYAGLEKRDRGDPAAQASIFKRFNL
jgi:MraZ protein